MGRKPPPGTPIRTDGAKPWMTNGLRAYWPFNEGAGRGCSSSIPVVQTYGSAWGGTWGPEGKYISGAAADFFATTDITVVPDGATYFMLATATSSSTSRIGLVQGTGAVPPNYNSAGIWNATGSVKFYWINDAGVDKGIGGWALTLGQQYSIAAVGSQTYRGLYRNGILYGSSSADAGALTWSAALQLGTTGNTWLGYVNAAGYWTRILSAVEVREIYYDPYGMFEPYTLGRFWSIPSGSIIPLWRQPVGAI